MLSCAAAEGAAREIRQGVQGGPIIWGLCYAALIPALIESMLVTILTNCRELCPCVPCATYICSSYLFITSFDQIRKKSAGRGRGAAERRSAEGQRRHREHQRSGTKTQKNKKISGAIEYLSRGARLKTILLSFAATVLVINSFNYFFKCERVLISHH